MMIDTDDPIPALGTIADEGRGSLPYCLIHGESLVACAAWALGDAQVSTVDLGVDWSAIAQSGEPYVIHDALCPMTPASFIAVCVARARQTGRAVVGVRPVTDTVKVVAGGRVGATLDRDRLIAVTSPLVVPATVLPHLSRPPASDLAAAVVELTAAGHPVDTLEAPPEGRRVASTDDVRLLEALTSPVRSMGG